MPVYRKINLARTDEEIQNCYPVMAELRPHIASDCEQIKSVSHVERISAHRFYLNKRMIIEAHYFSLSLN